MNIKEPRHEFKIIKLNSPSLAVTNTVLCLIAHYYPNAKVKERFASKAVTKYLLEYHRNVQLMEQRNSDIRSLQNKLSELSVELLEVKQKFAQVQNHYRQINNLLNDDV